MYFCDMICVSVRFAAGGTMRTSPRNVVLSAAVICVADCELISLLRAFTKSMCAVMPFVYAASAVALSPFR